MRPRHTMLWLGLVAMWLALNGTMAFADVVVGALVASAAVLAVARLVAAPRGMRRPQVAAALTAIVLADVVRSNVAVARVVLVPSSRGRRAGFVEVPLDVRRPAALATLACIVTATPGTAWAGYDSRANVLTIHVLDLVDGAEVVRSIKERYESRLMEIFE
jgi:multicomponent K+:H+ antiporter subunit E